jgi:hypothetical protein
VLQRCGALCVRQAAQDAVVHAHGRIRWSRGRIASLMQLPVRRNFSCVKKERNMTIIRGLAQASLLIACVAGLSANSGMRWPLSVPAGTVAPSDTTCGPNVTSVRITVSSETTPRITWEPKCSVAVLIVEVDSSGSDQWGITTPQSTWAIPDSANRILPPVGYGDGVAGADTRERAKNLIVGTRYEVVLWRIMPDSVSPGCAARRGPRCLIGTHTFTR